MVTAKRLHCWYEEYLTMLEVSAFKLEFWDGVIYTMAGGTVARAAIGAAAIRLIGQALEGMCSVVELASPRLVLSIDALYTGISLEPK